MNVPISHQTPPLPWLIQGGMGIAISGWPLARAVAQAGQLGVVSGTAINTVFARRLQDQGVDDALHAVLERFPVRSVVDDVLRQYASKRRSKNTPYRNVPMLTLRSPQRSIDLLVLSSFVEVSLAKEGHDGLIGINLLTKVQIPTLATLFGAILADVDYVMMGAGVPTSIPGILEQLSRGQEAEMALQVIGGANLDPAPVLRFDPERYLSGQTLRRPKFLGIVSSHVLATALAKRSNGPIDGFVVERPIAGGHNAPPRGPLVLDEAGNPNYGERDRVDYEVLRALDLPFWIGGGVTTREDVQEAFTLGATGVQVGTLFAYCQESGLDPALRSEVIELVKSGPVAISTSTHASPTGYPFKVASVPGTISDHQVYEERERKCDLGFLREAYLRPDGSLGYRCSAEPVATYIRKGGLIEDTEDRTCLCNGLMATCGLAQVRSDGQAEPAIVTSGDCVNEIGTLIGEHSNYSAADVIAHLQP